MRITALKSYGAFTTLNTSCPEDLLASTSLLNLFGAASYPADSRPAQVVSVKTMVRLFRSAPVRPAVNRIVSTWPGADRYPADATRPLPAAVTGFSVAAATVAPLLTRTLNLEPDMASTAATTWLIVETFVWIFTVRVFVAGS